MAFFGANSLRQRDTLHPDLQKVVDEAIKTYNFSIICGHRGEADQNRAFNEGKSKVKFPNSRHNVFPSQAVDVAPYPVNWKDIKAFKELAAHIKGCAATVGVEVEWGGDWKTFKDYPHFQLIKIK